MRSRLLSAEQFEDARQIMRDLDSLDGHTAFLFDKINFLMDATVGFININQNKIIKIFSVASVSLLPPTLELTYGYPLAIGHWPDGGFGPGADGVFPQARLAQVRGEVVLASSRNSRRKILPTVVLGSSSLNSISLGCL
jgi:hypothetical protein